MAPLPALTPSNSTTFSALGGALSVIVIWVIGLFHVVIPPEVAASIAVVVSTFAGYIPRSGRIHTGDC